MIEITVTASRTYQVLMAQGLLSQAGVRIGEVMKTRKKRPEKICIVTDDIVHDFYCREVQDALQTQGYETSVFVFPHGEHSKTLKTLSDLLEFLAEQQFTRSDMLVALGGGITGDLTGFAAASYLRGIEFVQIPTTLLAAVDSSVGGKTGVNLKAGKNLAGAFWQPSLVLFDPDTMQTLSPALLRDGIAEAIKAGAIADAELFTMISQCETINAPEMLTTLAARAVKIKRAVVEEDERDTGARQLLNFGHTIGHAIEKCSSFEISHGHAVAMGMGIVSKAAFAMGWSREDCFTPIRKALRQFHFPLDCPYSASQLTEAARKDKKRLGDTITLVIPQTLGTCILKQIPIEELEHFITIGLTS